MNGMDAHMRCHAYKNYYPHTTAVNASPNIMLSLQKAGRGKNGEGGGGGKKGGLGGKHGD